MRCSDLFADGTAQSYVEWWVPYHVLEMEIELFQLYSSYYRSHGAVLDVASYAECLLYARASGNMIVTNTIVATSIKWTPGDVQLKSSVKADYIRYSPGRRKTLEKTVNNGCAVISSLANFPNHTFGFSAADDHIRKEIASASLRNVTWKINVNVFLCSVCGTWVYNGLWPQVSVWLV